MLRVDVWLNFQTFSKFLKIKNFNCHIWIKHEKCIQMSTNKPSIGSVVLEITPTFVCLFLKNDYFSTAIQQPAGKTPFIRWISCVVLPSSDKKFVGKKKKLWERYLLSSSLHICVAHFNKHSSENLIPLILTTVPDTTFRIKNTCVCIARPLKTN